MKDQAKKIEVKSAYGWDSSNIKSQGGSGLRSERNQSKYVDEGRNQLLSREKGLQGRREGRARKWVSEERVGKSQ